MPFVMFSQSDSMLSKADEVSTYPLSIHVEYYDNNSYIDIKKFIDSNFIYPAYDNLGDFGTVYVEFMVDTLGVVDCVKVVKGISALIDTEAERVINLLPNLTPKLYRGKKINSYYIIPIKLKPEIDMRFISDVSPYFKGGLKARSEFIIENYKYPKITLAEKIEGTIYVQCLIEKDGSISNVSIRKGIHELYDKEAIRVIELMPNWIPAENNEGEKVEVYHIIQIKIQ